MRSRYYYYISINGYVNANYGYGDNMPTFTQLLAITIGSNIKNLRRMKFTEKGSLKNCAEALGLDPSYLVKWESGKVLPSEENQAKLAAFFGVSLAELRGDAPLVLCEECRKKNNVIKEKDEVIAKKESLIGYLHEELAERKRIIREVKDILEANNSPKEMIRLISDIVY